MKTKTPRERYEAFIKPAIELTNCSDYLKEIKKDYNEFIDLVVARMVAMDKNHRKYFPASRREMMQDGVYDEIIYEVLGTNISYEQKLALVAVQIEIVAQVAEIYNDSNLQSDLKYLNGDISSPNTDSYVQQGIRYVDELLYRVDEDDEEWEDEEYDDEESEEEK